ncbi:hypothetical protein FA15DRAFT_674240 [Coprinopsis marcescibilis]|uniref:CHAT domain-containing protein n=1 Tax=Coprinopsis marcescibilis TaxID=230819 RepID=A0A5C3KHG6_COPMA|nr:hypothetical protein FA15DRAFT_674240 [Coprinopsis marcescibilis]
MSATVPVTNGTNPTELINDGEDLLSLLGSYVERRTGTDENHLHELQLNKHAVRWDDDIVNPHEKLSSAAREGMGVVEMAALALEEWLKVDHKSVSPSPPPHERVLTHLNSRTKASFLPRNSYGRSSLLRNLAHSLFLRFQHKGDLQDLEHCISFERDALALVPSSLYDNRTSSLNALGRFVFTRFKHKGDTKDLNEAITLHEEACSLTPEDHPARSSSLHGLATTLSGMFEKAGNPKDLCKSIELYKEVLGLISKGHSDWFRCRTELADALVTLYRHTNDTSKLEQSIDLCSATEKDIPRQHPDRPALLRILANALFARFGRQGDKEDLDKTIDLCRLAIRLVPAPHPDRPESLNNLALALYTQFTQQGNIKDLDESIWLYREALILLPPYHSSRDVTLSNIASSLIASFEYHGKPEHLEEAIEHHKEALQLRAHPHPEHGLSLHNLALALFMRSKVDPLKHDEDLDQSIEYGSRALELSAYNAGRSAFVNNLTRSLFYRFRVKGESKDLNQCIRLQEESFDSMPSAHPERANSLHSLAEFLFARFTHSDQGNFELQDLKNCISNLREALLLQPQYHPHRAMTLFSLAASLRIWAFAVPNVSETHIIENLKESGRFQQEALELTPKTWQHDYPTVLSDSASLHRMMYRYSGESKDLKTSISLFQSAYDMMAPENPHRADTAGSLGEALFLRFRNSSQGVMEDLSRSIYFMKEALITPSPASRPPLTRALFMALLESFSRRKNDQDLKDSICYGQEALELTPHDSAERTEVLNALANGYRSRFDQTCNIADLNQALALREEAINLEFSNPRLLNNYSVDLIQRYHSTNDANDREKSIFLLQLAVNLIPPHSLQRAHILANLAYSIFERFQGSLHSSPGSTPLEDLSKIIHLYQQALNLTVGNRNLWRGHSSWLNNLGSASHVRFLNSRDFVDLEVAISSYENAQESDAPQSIERLLNLGDLLEIRYDQRTRDALDLEKSIFFTREAIGITPPTENFQTQRFRLLRSLGRRLRMKFLQANHSENQDLETTFGSLFDAIPEFNAGSLPDRIIALRGWGSCSPTVHADSSLEAYRRTIELILLMAPSVKPGKLDWGDAEFAVTVGDDAVECAIEAGDFENAVVFFFTCRLSVWSQVLQLRTSVDKLKAEHPLLCESLCTVSRGMDVPVKATSSPGTASESSNSRDQQSSPWQERQRIIAQVRSLDGFDEFLKIPSFTSLQVSTSCGPIIILSSGGYRSDALIVRAELPILHLPLHINPNGLSSLNAMTIDLAKGCFIPMVSVDGILESVTPDLQSRIKQFIPKSLTNFAGMDDGLEVDDGFRFILSVLWFAIVEPILQSLELPKTGSLARIWWCPVGKFFGLPIHAAGVYPEDPSEIDCLSDYAISSYLQFPQDLSPSTLPPTGFKMVATLSSAGNETQPRDKAVLTMEQDLTRIKTHITAGESSFITHDGKKEVLPETVVNDICAASSVHFSCPTQSAWSTGSWRIPVGNMELELSDLIKDGNRLSHRLAYLSLYQPTLGETESLGLFHGIPHALVAAGFKAVVGPMWAISNQDGPYMADMFYKHLLRRDHPGNSPIGIDTAEALHNATKDLKAHTKEFRRWVPFAHFGS